MNQTNIDEFIVDETTSKFLEESNAIEGVYGDSALAEAKLAWHFLSKCDELTSEAINCAHGILMRGQPLENKYKGAFRDCPVMIGGKFGANHMKVPALITAWCEKYGQDNLPKTKEEIIKAHVKYEEIHSHLDGNGRIGRLLLLWHTVKAGLPVEVIWSEDKWDNYYPWFVKVDL